MRPPWLVISTLLVFAVTPAAHADEASKAQKVEEFFQAAQLEQMFSQSMTLAMNQVKSSVMREAKAVNLSPGQSAVIEDFQSKVEAVVRMALSWDQLRPQYLKLYSDAFTEEQLDDLLAFYKSPTGQAMVSNSPLLMKQGAEITQQRMAVAQPELRRLVEEFRQKVNQQ